MGLAMAERPGDGAQAARPRLREPGGALAGARVKIVIFGLGKSGTSALFYKIVNSLPSGTIALFEPSSFGPRDALHKRLQRLRRGRLRPDIVAKVLPWGRVAVELRDFDGFDRQILIVRDPRDLLVSALLYESYHASFAGDDSAALRFLTLLKRKEADPRGVPLLHLVSVFEKLHGPAEGFPKWLDDRETDAVADLLRFHDERPHLFVFHYEDLVEERFAALERRLGFTLAGSVAVPDTLWRVVRTKVYGAWRNWFTLEDVDRLRPLLAPFLDRYYPGADWDLDPHPHISPQHGSLYVRRLLDERRAMSGQGPLPAD
jgi:hypothetical protein